MWQLALQQAVYNCPNHFRLIYQAEAYRSAKWSWKPKRATRGLVNLPPWCSGASVRREGWEEKRKSSGILYGGGGTRS